MNTLTNLSHYASVSLRRFRDPGFRRRLAAMHRSLVSMGREAPGGYIALSRDLMRTISAEGMVMPDECLLLMRMASEVRDGAIVEIGSYRGRSTIALAIGSSRGARVPVYAIDPHEGFTGVLGARFGPDDQTQFERNIERASIADLVVPVVETSTNASAGWKGAIELLWIDGDHRYEAVRQDFELWSAFVSAGGRIAFDDSTVPGLGPYVLIGEIISGGAFRVLETVGKITVVARADRNPRANGECCSS